MNISMLFFLLAVVVVAALLILYAVSRNRNVKASCRLPFVFFSFEAKQPRRADPKAE